MSSGRERERLWVYKGRTELPEGTVFLLERDFLEQAGALREVGVPPRDSVGTGACLLYASQEEIKAGRRSLGRGVRTFYFTGEEE